MGRNPWQQDPSKESNLDAELVSYLRARSSGELPKVPAGFQRGLDDDLGVVVLKHMMSGIVILDLPVQVPADGGKIRVVFHYTHREAFTSICRSRELWATLVRTSKQDRIEKDICFGEGLYVSGLGPCTFGSQERVLINNFTNAEEIATQLRHIGQHLKAAEYCIPILAPQHCVTNVMLQATPAMIYGAGYNRQGERIRPDRDISVVALLDQLGDVVNVQESAIKVGARVQRQGSGSCSPSMKKLTENFAMRGVPCRTRSEFYNAGTLLSPDDIDPEESLRVCNDTWSYSETRLGGTSVSEKQPLSLIFERKAEDFHLDGERLCVGSLACNDMKAGLHKPMSDAFAPPQPAPGAAPTPAFMGGAAPTSGYVEQKSPPPPLPATTAASRNATVEETWPNNADGYELCSRIGHGASAVVHRAVVQANAGTRAGSEVAVKIIELEECADSTLEEVRRELQMMRMCRHENVIQYHVAFPAKRQMWLVMPLMTGGSCANVMRSRYCSGGFVEECIIAYILRETLMAVKYFHSNKQIHRDIKAGNILLTGDGAVCLSDFGVAAPLRDDRQRQTFVGTPCWMAPEVLESIGYDYKADVWSYGITAIELAYGEAPYQRLHPLKVMKIIQEKDPPRIDRRKWDALFVNLIECCLQKDPTKRFTMEEILAKHAMFYSKADRGPLVNILQALPPLEARIRPTPSWGAGGEQSRASLATSDKYASWDFEVDDEFEDDELDIPFEETES